MGSYFKIYTPGEVLDVNFEGERYRGTVIRIVEGKPLVRIETDEGEKEVYRNPSWTCGYISKEGWDDGGGGWLDPQLVISRGYAKRI